MRRCRKRQPRVGSRAAPVDMVGAPETTQLIYLFTDSLSCPPIVTEQPRSIVSL